MHTSRQGGQSGVAGKGDSKGKAERGGSFRGGAQGCQMHVAHRAQGVRGMMVRVEQAHPCKHLKRARHSIVRAACACAAHYCMRATGTGDG